MIFAADRSAGPFHPSETRVRRFPSSSRPRRSGKSGVTTPPAGCLRTLGCISSGPMGLGRLFPLERTNNGHQVQPPDQLRSLTKS